MNGIAWGSCWHAAKIASAPLVLNLSIQRRMSNNCLSCYQGLAADEKDFHRSCASKFFGEKEAPTFDLGNKDLEDVALTFISRNVAVTGVQPKLSLDLMNDNGVKRLTVVGLWGNYILKPQSNHFEQLPENEDLTMHLAEIAEIKTVLHSLIRMSDGSLAYITKRIDRHKKRKLHMEDMCQLTGHLTEHKYRGSYEQIGKAFFWFSKQPGIDLTRYAEILLFSYLVGNADMHLKNFSILHKDKPGPVMSPAYDLVSTVIVNPDDKEETALTLNGKKNRITRKDFIALFNNLGLLPRQQENIFERLLSCENKWLAFINQSFLSPTMQAQYKELIQLRISQLED
jgi:serine/threonine-protein kinase HipA